MLNSFDRNRGPSAYELKAESSVATLFMKNVQSVIVPFTILHGSHRILQVWINVPVEIS